MNCEGAFDIFLCTLHLSFLISFVTSVFHITPFIVLVLNNWVLWTIPYRFVIHV